MNPRDLSILLIDDALTTEEEAQDKIEGYHMELYDFIRDWKMGLEFWSALSRPRLPDLAVSDVLFREDDDSPLARVPSLVVERPGVNINEPNPIPTGLMHVKDFAVIARFRGIPLGISLHTTNPSLWEEAWNLKPYAHPMGALAADQIGQLAAIRGDEGLRRLLAEDNGDLVSYCWRWLRENSEREREQVLPRALEDYRRQLLAAVKPQQGPPRVLVLPEDWARLMAWVERQRQNTAPIDLDLSVPLLYAEDGCRDEIRLVSMFAEMRDLTTKALPAVCYQTTELADTEPRFASPATVVPIVGPQIGRFLAALGSLATVCQRASELLRLFPLSRPEHSVIKGTLGEAIRKKQEEQEAKKDEVASESLRKAKSPKKTKRQKKDSSADLIGALAFFFRMVEYEKRNYDLWRIALEAVGWDRNQRQVNSHQGHSTLCQVLAELLDAITHCLNNTTYHELLESGEFNESLAEELSCQGDELDVFKAADSQANAWLEWHLTQLVAGEFICRASDGSLRLANPLKPFSPAAIPIPRTDFPTDLDLEPDVAAAARDSFGYGKRWRDPMPKQANDHAISRMLVNAFGLKNEKEAKEAAPDDDALRDESRPPGPATELIASIIAGQGPRWLMIYLRDYARRTLSWTEESTWPLWLRAD